MTIKQLKESIKDLPDDMLVCYKISDNLYRYVDRAYQIKVISNPNYKNHFFKYKQESFLKSDKLIDVLIIDN